MGQPEAVPLDEELAADLRRKAEAEGVSVSEYIRRTTQRKGVREFISPAATALPPKRTLDETISEAINRKLQLSMLKGLGVDDNESRPAAPDMKQVVAEAIAQALAASGQRSGQSQLSSMIPDIIQATVIGKVAQRLTSDDASNPINKVVEEQLKGYREQIEKLGGKIDDKDKALAEEKRLHEREALENDLEGQRQQIAELRDRLNNPSRGSDPQADFTTQANAFLNQLAAVQAITDRAKQSFGPKETPAGKDLMSQVVAGLEGLSKVGANFAETASKIATARKGGEVNPDYTGPSSTPPLYKSAYAPEPPAAPAPETQAPVAPAPPTPQASAPAPAEAPLADAEAPESPLNLPPAMSVSAMYGRSSVPVTAPPAPQNPAPEPEVAPPPPPSLQTASPELIARTFPPGVEYLDPMSQKVIPRDEFVARYGDVVLRNPSLVRVVGKDQTATGS